MDPSIEEEGGGRGMNSSIEEEGGGRGIDSSIEEEGRKEGRKEEGWIHEGRLSGLEVWLLGKGEI